MKRTFPTRRLGRPDRGTPRVAAPAIAVLLLLAAGCAGARRSEVTYHDPNMDFSQIQRVAVVPFVNLTPITPAAERVRDVFMSMLQATGSLYVLPPGEVTRAVNRAHIVNPQTPTGD